MKDTLILSVYGSHNAAISMYYKGEYTVVELERWLNSKNIGLVNYLPAEYPQLIFDEITEYLLNKTDRSDVDILLTGYADKIIPKFHVKETIRCDHHTAHAAVAFYQSPYKESIVFTFDGGGDGGFFNVYHASRTNGIKLLDKFNQDLGFPYMVICDYLKDIKKDPLNIGNLVYAGKVMGLCSYGKIIDEWVPYFDEFYTKFNYVGNSYIGGAEARLEALPKLFNDIGLTDFKLDGSVRYEGEIAWNIAATSQKSFENQFFKYASKYLDEYNDLPICMAGGCALNVLLNSKLLKLRNNKVFVPPNVNDCGISVGHILWYLNPDKQVDLTYSGIPILDKENFTKYIQDRKYKVYENVSIKELAEYINNGNIVGLIQGNSEHGSRALGNRSILCAPSEGMKDILNEKVKHREWYRPFAPIVRLQDASKYFEWDDQVESRHMTYVAIVREEWRSTLPAITHEDNTARLQTVTKYQNKLIYNLITEFEAISGYGVILNTSFNDNGKPILSRLEDAFNLLDNTELDAIFYQNNLILKKNNDKFKSHTKNKKILDDDTTSYILSVKNDQDQIIKEKCLIEKLKEKYKKVILITSYENKKHFNDINENEYFKIRYITPQSYFYRDRLDKKFNLSSNTYSYSKIIKMLWVKDILKENILASKYHLILNLDNIDFNDSIEREMELIINLSNYDDNILVSSKQTCSDIFETNVLEQKYRIKLNKLPTILMMHGSYDNMNWMLQNYEGMLLWHADNNHIGSEDDYLLMSFVENPHRYKIL